MFSASIAPAAAASALGALTVLKEDSGLIEKLWENTHYAISEFKNAGFDIGPTETPIIPVYIRDNDKTFLMAKMLMDEGVFVNPVVSPAVQSDSSLIRFSLMATHSREQIDFAIDKFKKAAGRVEVPLTETEKV
jgi:8-amino-7-oxononanoate synthase